MIRTNTLVCVRHIYHRLAIFVLAVLSLVDSRVMGCGVVSGRLLSVRRRSESRQARIRPNATDERRIVCCRAAFDVKVNPVRVRSTCQYPVTQL